MGCSGKRRVEVRPEAKWDYITLNDFKATSCFAPFAYCYLWFSLFLSIAVYGVDGFTAVNLLVFDKWSSDIEPSQLVPFDVSKWIFAICIILSVINLLYEHIRAHRVMRRGSVAECYLDSLAARLESIRFGSGKGFKRFLVFAELTKSKKGAEYIALFSYFSFQSWIRVLVCSGPRQAINALTLYSVYTAKLTVEGKDFGSSLSSFFDKIKSLGVRESFILSGMVFTLVIWVFSFLSLLLAGIFFVFFLSHYIPWREGGLAGYCERKATKRLMQIVSHKINKAMEDEEKKRRKAELRAAKKTGGDRPISMKATLPDVGGDKLPTMPMLNGNDTVATLPVYTSRPGSPGSIELGTMDRMRPQPSRTGTAASSVSNAPSYSSRQGLLGAAAQPGFSRSESPAPSLPPMDLRNLGPSRSGTMTSNNSFGPRQTQLNRTQTNGSGFGGRFTESPATFSSDTVPPLPLLAPSSSTVGNYGDQVPYPMNQQGQNYRQPSDASDYMSARGTPVPYSLDRQPTQGSVRQPYDDYSSARGTPAPYPMDNRRPPSRRPTYADDASARASPAPYSAEAPYPSDDRQPPNSKRPTHDDYSSARGSPAPYPPDNRPPQNPGRPLFDASGRASPAPTVASHRTGPLSPTGTGPSGYPGRSMTNPMPRPLGPQFSGPSRVMTAPLEGPQHHPNSSNGSLRNILPNNPRPFHQPTFSNSSLPNREPTLPQIADVSESGGYDYFNRPPTSSSQRSGPRNGNSNGNGWNQDVEKGQPRY